jgi:hypothetical protein
LRLLTTNGPDHDPLEIEDPQAVALTDFDLLLQGEVV